MRMIIALALSLIAAQPARAELVAPADQARAIEAAAGLIERRYVDPAKGKAVAAALRRSLGLRRGAVEAAIFAGELTEWLRRISGDGHFAVEYSATPLDANGGETAYSEAETLRYYGPQLNHGVAKVERLDGNVMLLDLTVFPPPALAGDIIAAAMTLVAQGDALIIDLRHNGGGMETANLVTGYLLAGGSPLSGTYDRPSDRLLAQSSPEWVPGRRFGEVKPLFILTSRHTFSAAEALAYDLQALKRATIVGEVTGGGANPFEYRRITEHFALSLPEQRSLNPITGTNWQGTGVKPDVAVPAVEALEKALALARQAIKDRLAAASDPRSLP